MVSINQKVLHMIESIEAILSKEQKNIPLMARSMYKPMLATLKALVFVAPEEKLKFLGDKANLLLESVFTAQHETLDDFKTDFEKLLSQWN